MIIFRAINWAFCSLGRHEWRKDFAWGRGGYPVWACYRCGKEKRR